MDGHPVKIPHIIYLCIYFVCVRVKSTYYYLSNAYLTFISRLLLITVHLLGLVLIMEEFFELNRALPCKFTYLDLFLLEVFHPIRIEYQYVVNPTYIIKKCRVHACCLCVLFLGEDQLKAITISIT